MGSYRIAEEKIFQAYKRLYSDPELYHLQRVSRMTSIDRLEEVKILADRYRYPHLFIAANTKLKNLEFKPSADPVKLSEEVSSSFKSLLRQMTLPSGIRRIRFKEKNNG